MAETKETKEVEEVVLKANVKFVKSPNPFGYSNFIGDEAYVNPKHIITVEGEDGKTSEVSALEYFLENNIAKKL